MPNLFQRYMGKWLKVQVQEVAEAWASELFPWSPPSNPSSVSYWLHYCLVIISGCLFSLETYSCFLFFPSSLPPTFPPSLAFFPPSLPSPSHLFLFHIPLLIDIFFFFFLVPCFLKGVFSPLKDLAKCECVSSAFYLTPRLNLFPQEETIRIKTLGWTVRQVSISEFLWFCSIPEIGCQSPIPPLALVTLSCCCKGSHAVEWCTFSCPFQHW